MTYKELLEVLQTVSKEQSQLLDQDVTVHLTCDDEYHPVQAVCVAVEDEVDVLDAMLSQIGMKQAHSDLRGHLVLKV
ncbi:MAG TPA: hypothetical protein EYO59_03980 [Chromatiaceae bacterium]|nr:hypothetical protein [Chromatiaceae bacterium]